MEGAHQKQAVAKIQWNDKEYFMSQKRITIGRHSSKGQVDVDLGDSSFISRVHLEIHYKDPDFFLRCNGKNGIFVDDDFQRPCDGFRALPSRCFIGFPSTGMFLVFSSLLGGSAINRPCLPSPVSVAALTPSSAGTTSACSSRPVSPTRPGEVTIISSANVGASGDAGAQSSIPLMHHSYSSGFVEQRAPVQEKHLECGEKQGRSKPPFSYAQLIVQAISSSRERQLTLSGIYSYITRHYPYYRTADKGWQNSIRHNLSLNRSFIKVARGQEQPGKGSYWRVEPQSEAKLIEQAFRGRRRRAGANGDRTGAADLSPGSPSHWTQDGATPPYLESREASPVPASPYVCGVTPTGKTYSSGVAATVIVTSDGSGSVARARLVPLSSARADSLETSHVPDNDVIIAPSVITVSDNVPYALIQQNRT